jgi:hypothetical protein
MAIDSTSTTASMDSQRPAESGGSYFPSPPETPEDSPRVSVSEGRFEGPTSKLAPIRRTDTGNNPLPPYARDFPEPAEDIDVAKQLALKPLNRSLHDSLKRFGTQDRFQKAEDPEARAAKMEAAKKQILDLHSQKTW